MRVREWMSIHPVTITAQTSVLNARRLLRLHRVRHLPVVTSGDHLVGIVSDRDIELRDDRIAVALSALQSDLLAGRYRCVDTIMAAPVHTVGPDEPVSLAAKLMLRWQVNALPVIDHGRLVGIVTTADCLRALVAQLHEQARHQQATGVMDDDPDWYKLTPMPTGDDRPGRRTRPVPAAVKTVQQSPATAVVAASSADALASVSLVKEPTGIAG